MSECFARIADLNSVSQPTPRENVPDRVILLPRSSRDGGLFCTKCGMRDYRELEKNGIQESFLAMLSHPYMLASS